MLKGNDLDSKKYFLFDIDGTLAIDECRTGIFWPWQFHYTIPRWNYAVGKTTILLFLL